MSDLVSYSIFCTLMYIVHTNIYYIQLSCRRLFGVPTWFFFSGSGLTAGQPPRATDSAPRSLSTAFWSPRWGTGLRRCVSLVMMFVWQLMVCFMENPIVRNGWWLRVPPWLRTPPFCFMAVGSMYGIYANMTGTVYGIHGSYGFVWQLLLLLGQNNNDFKNNKKKITWLYFEIIVIFLLCIVVLCCFYCF